MQLHAVLVDLKLSSVSSATVAVISDNQTYCVRAAYGPNAEWTECRPLCMRTLT